MKQIPKILHKLNWQVFVVGMLAACFRLGLLAQLPPAITNDELEYVTAAKAIFLQGRVLSYTSPTGLFSYGNGLINSTGSLAELPPYIIAPIIGPLENSLFIARLPYALVSIGIVLVLYYLVLQLFGNQWMAFSVGVVACVNPWAIHFGRTSFEFTFAIFFYLWGIYLLIRNKKYDTWFALALMLLAFFSYHGTKILLIPIVVITTAYTYLVVRRRHQFFTTLLVPVVVSAVVFVGYAATLRLQPAGNRASEVLFADTDTASQVVQQERRQSLSNSPQAIFYNKPTYFLRKMVNNYLGAFSVDKLFINGEGGTHVLTFYQHGMFYTIDFLLLIVGIFACYEMYRKSFYFLSALAAIAPLPSVIHKGEATYVIRSSLLFAILIIFIGMGAYFLLKKNAVFRNAKIIGVAAYVLFIIQFGNLYINRLPIYNSEAFFYQQKILARYISLVLAHNPEQKIIVTVREPNAVFQQYLFYTNQLNSQSIQEIDLTFQKKMYALGSVEFDKKCPTAPIPDETLWIHEDSMQCDTTASASAHISSPADAGSMVTIRNDKICTQYELPRYPSIKKLHQLDVFNLTEEEFCTTWINFL